MDTIQEQELRRIQDQAVTHAIEEMGAAAQLGIVTKEDRGDRFWLTKMAAQSMTVAARIEGYIMLRSREGSEVPQDDDNEHRAVDAMIKRAQGQVESIIARAKSGYKPRGSDDE